MASFKRSASRDVVVLDLSSLLCKIGFGGEGSPRYILRLGLPKSTSGTEALLDGAPGYEHDVEQLLRDVFLRRLMCSPRDRKVIICESIVEPSKTRETLLKVLLERLKVASVLLMPAPVLSVYAAGMDDEVSALVLQVGYSESTALPVCNAMPLLHAMATAAHGTKAVHKCILHLAHEGTLIQWSEPSGSGAAPPRQLHSGALSKFGSALAEDLDDVMARLCFLEGDGGSEQAQAPEAAAEEEDSSSGDAQVLVGSGGSVQMAAAARRGVCGVLFGGGCGSYLGDSELSAARLVLEALLACSIDVRPQVAKRVVLAGGGVMIRGFAKRLLSECRRLCASEPRFSPLSALVSGVLAVKPTPFQPNTLPLQSGAGPPEPLFTSPAAAAHFLPPLPCGVDLSWPSAARRTTQA